jgi:hypothetical protein
MSEMLFASTIQLGGPGETNSPLFGRTNNPWNTARTPGQAVAHQQRWPPG